MDFRNDQKISKVFRYSSAFMLNYVQRSFRKITVSEIVQMISEVFRCFRYVQQCCWYMFRSVSAEKNTVSNFSKLFQTGFSIFQQILRKKFTWGSICKCWEKNLFLNTVRYHLSEITTFSLIPFGSNCCCFLYINILKKK